MKTISILILLLLGSYTLCFGFESDSLQTEQGQLIITFIGHGTLYFQFQDKVVHVDPWTRLADYKDLPKADLILITHHHGDHLDTRAVEQIRKENTQIVMSELCSSKVDGIVMHNGDEKSVQGFSIKAVPAYNIKHMRDNNTPYHPKGDGNGYVITFADLDVYVAGDTENVPEMAELKDQIEIAFLPMNLPYTMSPQMAADAARSFSPDILYPYHYGDTDATILVDLLKDTSMDVRIRDMQ